MQTAKIARLLSEPTNDPKLAGLHPLTYAMFASGGLWQPAPHLAAIAILMTAATTRNPDARRIQVSMPPRHGKSQFISDYLLAWHLGQYPNRRLMLTSYGQSYIEGWSLNAQQHFVDTFAQCWPRASARTNGLTVHPRHRGADWWWLAPPFSGYLTAAGVGGILTGKGADGLVCDDLVKNQAEADSEVMRDATFNFIQGTAMTRLEPGGWAVALATRWHEDDVLGRMLEWSRQHGDSGALPWLEFNLPAIAEEDEEFYLPWDTRTPLWARKKGEALWPERWPRSYLDTMQADTHPRIWNAQYQGRPTAKGGALFKSEYFRSYGEVVSDGRRYFSLMGRLVAESDTWSFGTADVAGTVKTSSDYTAIEVWTLAGFDLLLREVRRFRLESPDQPEAVCRLLRDWPQLAFVGIEDKTFGTSLIQTLVRAGLPIKPLKADTDKIARALPISLKYLHGQVWHPASAPDWLPAYEHECLTFPNGAHDDQVDAAAYAALLVNQFARPTIVSLDTPVQRPTSQETYDALKRRLAGLDDDWD